MSALLFNKNIVKVWMKNCLVSRAYCFRKLYVYIEDWIKFAFVQIFYFFSLIFASCRPGSCHYEIINLFWTENWTLNKLGPKTFLCNIFLQLTSLEENCIRELFILYTAKCVFQYLTKHILNRFEDRFYQWQVLTPIMWVVAWWKYSCPLAIKYS